MNGMDRRKEGRTGGRANGGPRLGSADCVLRGRTALAWQLLIVALIAHEAFPLVCTSRFQHFDALLIFHLQ